MLLLHLRTKDAYEASCKPVLLKAMARRYDVDEVAVERVLREFDLFELDEERQMFRSSYLDRVMKSLEEKRKMDIENGKKGGFVSSSLLAWEERPVQAAIRRQVPRRKSVLISFSCCFMISSVSGFQSYLVSTLVSGPVIFPVYHPEVRGDVLL